MPPPWALLLMVAVAAARCSDDMPSYCASNTPRRNKYTISHVSARLAHS
jgi:hypothetical protein